MIWNLRPRINKKNKQVNFSIPKKSMPTELREMLKKNPTKLKRIRIKLEGFE